jgi:hypothetical protein
MGARAVGDNFAVGRLPAPLMCENPSQKDEDLVSESGPQFPLGHYSSTPLLIFSWFYFNDA